METAERDRIFREMTELRDRLRTQLTEWHVRPDKVTATVLLALAVQCVDADEPDDLEFLIAALMKCATGKDPTILRHEIPRGPGEEN